MTSFSLRRLVLACTVSAAAVVAVAAPGTASAASDLGEQCSGSSIKGDGSSFQAPILKKWATEFSESKNRSAAMANRASKGTPKVEYLQGTSERGSGACLHGWGAESTEELKYGKFGFCGTDEAPNPTQKKEIEQKCDGWRQRKIARGDPCPTGGGGGYRPSAERLSSRKAKSKKAASNTKLGRLVLDDTSIEGVYAGTIKTWKQLLENQVAEGGAGNDKLTCKEASRRRKANRACGASRPLGHDAHLQGVPAAGQRGTKRDGRIS